MLHQDETDLQVEGKRCWMHVSATEQLTHYAVHPKRGKEALDAIGILQNLHGVSLHDGWHSYWLYADECVLCNIHHLRGQGMAALIALAQALVGHPVSPAF